MHRTGSGVLPGGKMPRRCWALSCAVLLVLLLITASPAWAKTKHTFKPNVAGEWVFATGDESEPDFADILNIGQSINGELRGSAQIIGGEYGSFTGSISGSSVSITVPFGGFFGDSIEPFLLVTFTGSLEGEDSISGHWTSTEAQYEETGHEEFKVVRVEGPKGDFTAERYSHGEDGEEAKAHQEEREEKEEEEDPTVTSVTDNATGSKQGPLIGGDELTVRGTGFDPEDGEVEVKFEADGLSETEDVAPSSETELQVAVPSLAGLASSVPEGSAGLPVSVRVHFERVDEEGEDLDLTSPASSNAVYEALLPHIASITDAASHVDVGSIAGGEALTIRGSGFFVPAGGKAAVSFMFDGQALGEPIEVTPSSATEIQLKAPNLSKYASKIPPGQDRLGMDAVVTIAGSEGGPEDEEQSRIQRSGEGAPNETGDGYEALSLAVESVTDEVTGTNSGSILGGDQLKIQGSGFEVPEGGTATVTFEQNGEVLGEPVTATAKGTEELFLAAPDFAKFQSKIAGGKDALALTVRVTIEVGGERIESERLTGADTGDDTYEAFLPQVQSVTDIDTGTDQGSILGGDDLKIEGAGFTVPEGGKLHLGFVLDGQTLAEEDVTPIGPSEIEIKAPDLAKFQSKIPEGQDALKLEVDLIVSDGTEEVQSGPPIHNTYEAFLPQVQSVTDTDTGTDQGSILGGDDLKIEGAGFTVPAGGKLHLGFVLDGQTLAEEDVTPSGGTIEVKTPDLAKFQSKIPEGQDALKLEVDLIVSDGTEEVQSGPPIHNTYEAVLPEVTAVKDAETGVEAGSILGGDELKIEGSGFSAPAGGKTRVVFSHDGTPLGEDEVMPVSETEIDTKTPDLSQYVADIKPGEKALGLEVRVDVSDGEHEVTGAILGDEVDFVAFIPVVASVTDAEIGDDFGPILGGNTIKIEGVGFEAPEGGKTRVRIAHEGTVLLEEEVTPVSESEIELVMPDLAEYAAEVAPGDGVLPLEVSVAVSDGTREVAGTVEGEKENYFAHAPIVTSLKDTATGVEAGSILGGDELKIEGGGFIAPDGGKTRVIFSHDGTEVSEQEVTPVNEAEIDAATPNLSEYAPDIKPGEKALALEVRVDVSDGKHVVKGLTGNGANALFAAFVPVVASVENTDSGTDHGSILGDGELEITGVGFEAPEGGKTRVEFAHDGTVLAEEEVTPESESAIALKAPDLSKYASDIGPGSSSLGVEVRVAVSDGAREVQGEIEGSTENYFADALQVSSVGNETAGTSGTGAILGGETLKITGSGFEAPLFGKVKVRFDEDGTALFEETVMPLSASEIEVTSPDLSKYASEIPAGMSSLDLTVTVVVEGEGRGVQSNEEGPGSAYAAELPKVESVEDTATDSREGTALGGDTLLVKGAWLEAPGGGSTEIEFKDTEGPEQETSVAVTAVSSTEALLTTPDLLAVAAEDQSNAVATDVLVSVSNGANTVTSHPPGEDDAADDTFLAEGPDVTSVENEADGSSVGSIDGGRTWSSGARGSWCRMGVRRALKSSKAAPATPCRTLM